MLIPKRFSLKFILMAVCMLLLVLSGNAQSLNKGTLTGKVVDETNLPLPFVSLFLKNCSDSTFYKTGISGNDGTFSFGTINKGCYVLQIKMLGFKSYATPAIAFENNTKIDLGVIKLLPATKMLNAVTIKAQTQFIERRADKIVVNLDNGLTAGQSIMEVMDKLPGVTVNPDDQISLNGQGVQIYIDGKATPLSSSALSSLLKGMSSTNIQKIELIAHPSARYDAAGAGGIINIVRKRNHKEGLNGNVYGGAGQGRFGKQNGGLNLNYKNTGYNLFFNADYSHNKYYVDNNLVSDFFDGNHVFTNQNVSAINSIRSNATYTPTLGLDLYLSKKTTLSFSATNGLQVFDRNALSSTNLYTANQAINGSNSFSNLVKTNTNNFSSGMHLLHQLDTLGKEYTIDMDYFIYTNNSNQHNQNTNYDTLGTFTDAQKTLFNQDRRFDVYSAKADYQYPLKNNAHLEFGFKSSYVVSNNSNMLYNIVADVNTPNLAQNDYFKYSENINALYFTYNKEHKRFSYQLGLRGEGTLGTGQQQQTGQTFDKKYIQLFPSAYFDFKLNANESLNLTLNKRIDRPTYENLNPLLRIINSTTYLQGNPQLQPAILYNASVTNAFKNAFFATINYSISLHDFTFFTSPYNGDKTITTTRPDNNRYTQYASFILAYNRQITPWWFTSTNVNLNEQWFKTTDNDVGVYNKQLLTANFDTYNSFALNKKLSFLLLLKYRGKAQDRNVVNDPYFVATTGLRQALFGSRGWLALNVTDILHTYKIAYVQNSVSVNQYWANANETTAVRLSLSYSFGGKIKKTTSSNGAVDEKQRTSTKEN
ncbi:outer membrane receptor protein involved in Fe transport [Mucilaginibacter gracilis]|uniref:Outer membrane receptor protein involved in Fe transport n=1 Tax=Mucilaginibacter gracilis TaxID=423350 RepID=A0A495IUN4_9SPHI|nr:outer membrane beta-barrel family protein [Mucilaginibacter gracilis]RKR80183.1 outer membrane receptor protein involved in Fe transport [Mucilaginibacter gracilis]